MNKPISHAKRRCRERTGTNLSIGRHERFIKQIQDNKAKFVKRSSRTRTQWIVYDKNTKYHVVYSRISKKIITVLDVV